MKNDTEDQETLQRLGNPNQGIDLVVVNSSEAGEDPDVDAKTKRGNLRLKEH